ncbi:hypothetical protein QTP70_021391 [Hemibagrus guttatus]|uniref:ribonuclease H n=1 Tax=Hemibagrus guttatus TaxID=175788 RepID=A0AAE0QJD0_9TELE|nr:hypothetical protein QTP70_021391 [Hemibagrus guttatus]
MGLCGYVVVPWRCLAVLALRLLFLVPAGVPARSGDSYLKDNITVRQGDSAVLKFARVFWRDFQFLDTMMTEKLVFQSLPWPQVYKIKHLGMQTASTNIRERMGRSQLPWGRCPTCCQRRRVSAAPCSRPPAPWGVLDPSETDIVAPEPSFVGGRRSGRVLGGGRRSKLLLGGGRRSKLLLGGGRRSKLLLGGGRRLVLRLGCGRHSALRLGCGRHSALRLGCGPRSAPPLGCGRRVGPFGLAVGCNVDSKVSRVAWLNRTTILFTGSEKWSLDPRVVLLNNTSVTEYSIKILDVNLHDEGPYVCSILTNKKPESTKVHLVVQAFLSHGFSRVTGSDMISNIDMKKMPGLTTTAIGAVDLQGAGGNWASVGRRSRGGRRVHRQREKRKGKSVGLRIGTLNVGTMTGKGRELADMMERRKVDILCVQETRWKGSKARSIGAGFKLFYYGVEVKRVSDRVMSLKLEIEGVMLNVVSGYAPQVGCELEEKERFWSKLDEVMESIPTGERVVIGADFNGYVGEGNTGDEEVMGKFGVKERNLEGQMGVDFAKRMDKAVVNTYFQKREEHRVTYKSGGRRTQVDYILCRRGNLKEISDCKVVVGESVARQHRMVVCRMTLMVCKKKRSKIEKKTKWWKLKKEECCEKFRQKLRQALGGQVVLPDDWETTVEVIRETGRKVLGVSSGRRKEDKETWWWNEEVQDSVQRKRLAKKKWDMDRTEENRQEYKELQRRVKREVSKAKQKAYEELYTRLDTREGQKDLYSLFNRVLESERMPEEWRRSVLVPIFKNKGDVQSCSNYRGIKLMSHGLWERVVEARLRKVVEICELQYGFMPRKSTTDAIFALRILMEKYRDGQRELHCVFVDLEKAYDRVPREELWYCMRKSGVAEKYVRVVQDMYERSRTVRCAVGQTEEFNVEVGLHQGSALSPFLFAIVMDQLSEEVRQESPWTMMFADDIVICIESREQVEESLERWRFALERRGMKISRIQSNGECGKEVNKRVQAVPARIVNISTDITVNEGSNISLMCLAIGRPEPSIIWKYRSARGKRETMEILTPLHCSALQRQAKSESNGRRFISEGEYVEMTAITKEQSGSYECISSNDISPPDVRTVQVTVNYPPVISQARSTGTAVGQRGVLQCEASAVPLADFQWYKEERRLSNGLNGVKIENKGKQSMLIFFNVSEEDYGNYTCVAMNTLGITNASIILYGPGAIHDVNSAALSPSSSVCPLLTLILFYLKF